MIFAHTGSNVRHALKGRIRYIQNQAHLLLPRRTGDATALPLKTMGRYLGVIVSYHAFEQQTWLHRKKTAWIAYARLKRWLRHRQIRQSHRVYLWHTCVHTILTYGIFGTGVTVQSLTDYQLTVFQMIRILIGDHSYKTGHTHQRAIQNQSLPLPLQLLKHGAEKLWLRLQRRALQLDTTDFLQQVDWQHHHDTMRLIDQVHHSMPDVPHRWRRIDDDTTGAIYLPTLQFHHQLHSQSQTPPHHCTQLAPISYYTHHHIGHVITWQSPMQTLSQTVHYLAQFSHPCGTLLLPGP